MARRRAPAHWLRAEVLARNRQVRAIRKAMPFVVSL